VASLAAGVVDDRTVGTAQSPSSRLGERSAVVMTEDDSRVSAAKAEEWLRQLRDCFGNDPFPVMTTGVPDGSDVIEVTHGEIGDPNNLYFSALSFRNLKQLEILRDQRLHNSWGQVTYLKFALAKKCSQYQCS
jgi:hypothetical protein